MTAAEAPLTHRSEPRGPRQPGSKMHAMSDANGLPLLVGLTAAKPPTASP